MSPLLVIAILAATAGSRAQTHGEHHVGLFWKASSANGTVYLLGSMHIGSAKMYPLPAAIEAAFGKSSALIVELDPDSADPKVEAFLDKNGVYPDGDDVYRHLHPGYAEKLKKFAAKLGAPEENLGSLKPWVLVMLSGAWPAINGGKTLELGIDEHFLKEARGHKPILSIESAQFQLGIFASVPEETQLAILEKSLDETDSKVASTTDAMQRAWVTGDTRAVESVEIGYLSKYPALRRKLLDDRNVGMADFAADKLKSGGIYFMVVGAAHMLGNQGIVSLLRRRGYNVVAER